jgi:hypothetical protein
LSDKSPDTRKGGCPGIFLFRRFYRGIIDFISAVSVL